ncbi:hypothetical protein ACIQPR_13760 [Streptomyces sp. NPDC091280]|uniref:hypothetical protein n=1 Tax=Streptomyces sp. NPDC091280 TaxID=3365984 RepID=UPI003815CAA7
MTTVHQILFGWAERNREGNAGVRPVAHSGAPTIDRWAGRLEYVWAAREGAHDDTDDTASLVHLVFEDEAAVLRKLPARNVHGRGGATLTHALVGDPRTIDARLALGLHDWDGWRETEPAGASAVLDPLDLADLSEASATGLAGLRERAAGIPPEQLTALLGRVLGEPAADFTVITRPSLALPMMTALLDIVGPVTGRPWTFAGRESTDVGGHQPRVVFLTAPPPPSYYVNRRLRVEPATVPPDPDGPRFAGQLTELYLSCGHTALARIRPQHPLAGADDVAAWQRSVPVVDGRIAEPRLDLDVLVDDELLATRGHLPTVHTRLAAELCYEPVDWLAAVVRRWGPDELRAVRHPDLRDIVLKGALRSCLGVLEPAADPLVEAIAAARPEPRTVAAAFRRRLPDGGLDLIDPQHLRLLVVALSLGLMDSELDRPETLAATPATVLVDFVADYGHRFPDAAYVVLRRWLGSAADRQDGHADVTHVWYENDLLLSQVERIADHDPVKERECYRLLLSAAYGPSLSAGNATALMRHAGDRAPSGLLAAALERAADDSAEWPIRKEASDRYLREEGHRLDNGTRRPTAGPPAVSTDSASRPTTAPAPAPAPNPYPRQPPPAAEQAPDRPAPHLAPHPATEPRPPVRPPGRPEEPGLFGRSDGTAFILVLAAAIVLILLAVAYILLTSRT